MQINISPSSVAKFPLLWTAGVEFDTFVGHFHGVVSFDIKTSSCPSVILIEIGRFSSTHSAKINRRSIYLFGFLALILLVFQTGWEVTKAINEEYVPELWPFYPESFADSTVWFNALVQVIYSLNIGIGAIPVLTGKFLYKGDAIK